MRFMRSRVGLWVALCFVAIAAAAVFLTLPGSSPVSPYAASAAPRGAPLATYVSTSGISHDDVANLRGLPTWHPGLPNGINKDWRVSIDNVWTQIESEHADAVFAQGDMVQGFWGVDDDHTGIFGPIDTYRHRLQAIHNAGDSYYHALKREYRAHGLTVYPGMGDHEMGGLDTDGNTAPHTFRARAYPEWVKTWEANFHHRAYYHVKLPGSVELWTLKPFRQDPDGGVSAILSRAERRWLSTSLDRSTARWKIVQSEIPPYSSPGFHGIHTSQTHLIDAQQVWTIMRNHGVDLMLCAEFHDVDALQRGGLPEIIHGGAVAGLSANYLRIDVYRDRLAITLTRMANGTTTGTGTLWAPSDRHRSPLHIHMTTDHSVTGHMVVGHDGIVSADGELVPY